MNSDNKICCFVVPYFGTLPDSMPVFLESCRKNPDYSWLIFTDDNRDYDYPANVIVRYCSFEDIRARIQSCFDFETAIPRAQKLCDFKPAYGYIFQEELRGFPYWGYCDLDQLFGNLSHFIPLDFLEKYDKIFSLGHMTIYRNDPKVSKMFMGSAEMYAVSGYRQIFSSPESFCFDEWPSKNVNINILAEASGARINYDWPMCDIMPYKSVFTESKFDAETRRWYTGEKNVLLVSEHDELKMYYLLSGRLQCKEIAYAHIQKRRLSSSGYHASMDAFWIVPNKIRSFSCAITERRIISQLKKISVSGVFHVQELKRSICLAKALWVHRFKKYILHQ